MKQSQFLLGFLIIFSTAVFIVEGCKSTPIHDCGQHCAYTGQPLKPGAFTAFVKDSGYNWLEGEDRAHDSVHFYQPLLTDEQIYSILHPYKLKIRDNEGLKDY